MTKEQFVALVKRYSKDCCILSHVKQDHPALIEILAAGPEVIPFALERLQDSIGQDSGDATDEENDPWMLVHDLLGKETHGFSRGRNCRL